MEKIENEEVASKRQQFLEKYKEKYSNINTDDDEELYGKIYDDYEGYEGRIKANEENNRKMLDLFNTDNRSAAFLMKWKEGINPVVALIEEFGNEFRDAIDDPDKLEELSEATRKYNERILKSEKLNKEADDNLEASISALDEAQKELKASDESVTKAFELYNNIINDGIVNKVSKETWMMFLKAINYDTDVAGAEHNGVVRGLNTKIDKEKRKATTPMPPSLAGQAKIEDTPKKDYGALDRYSNSEDIWSRGRKK